MPPNFGVEDADFDMLDPTEKKNVIRTWDEVFAVRPFRSHHGEANANLHLLGLRKRPQNLGSVHHRRIGSCDSPLSIYGKEISHHHFTVLIC